MYLVLINGIAQSLDGLDVQMICRLVKDEKVGPMRVENGESHTRFLASGQTANLHREHMKKCATWSNS